MKKIVSIILTAALITSLTACSAAQPSESKPEDNRVITVENPKDSPAEDIKDDIGDETESIPESIPESASEEEPGAEKTDEKIEDPEASEETSIPDQAAVPEKTETITLPLKEYPDGSYFTYDKMPCDDHDKCDWAGECNCVKFDRAIQAVGFAKYVYYEVTGKHASIDNKTNIDLDITADSAKSCLMGAPAGTYISAETNNELPHAMAVVDSNDKGITVYQANYGGKCLVSVMTLTWEEFAERFPHLDYYIK